VKLSAKLYGATTIGPHCKVGGEVSNSVIFGYSNKGHDGFLGNSVLGEWCNIGADSNNSNLKNNYEEVKLWSYETENFAKTGLQFCGLMMGDHSKCGINTMFNTGTVVGVSANIFGSGFPRNFVPSFSWGGAAGFTTYLTKKAFEVAKVVMSRRKVDFTAVDQRLLEKVFELSSKWRKD
jgi:UDP-N-acetylglucosamine diphosphorylase/glucosamine-1-phosphate N-acetyltransferase